MFIHENIVIPPQYLSTKVVDVLKSLLAGGIAGGIAKTVTAPFDRIKIMYQVTNQTYSLRNAISAVRDVLRNHGYKGLFIGNNAVLIRIFPYAAIELASFDQLKLSVIPAGPNGRLSTLQRMTCGSVAGALAVVCTYPLDVIRARMALQFHIQEYNGSLDAIMKIYRSEGIGALYRGIYPTLLGIIPYAGITFYCNDTLKHFFKNRKIKNGNKNPELYTLEKLFCGALAGLIGQSSTYPLDTIRRRMQTEGFLHTQNFGNSIHQQKIPKGFLGTIMMLYKQDPTCKIFFKGLSLVWLKGPVTSGTAFVAFDIAKKSFGVTEHDI